MRPSSFVFCLLTYHLSSSTHIQSPWKYNVLDQYFTLLHAPSNATITPLCSAFTMTTSEGVTSSHDTCKDRGKYKVDALEDNKTGVVTITHTPLDPSLSDSPTILQTISFLTTHFTISLTVKSEGVFSTNKLSPLSSADVNVPTKGAGERDRGVHPT